MNQQFTPGQTVVLDKDPEVSMTIADIPADLRRGTRVTIDCYDDFKHGHWFVRLRGLVGTYQENLFRALRPRIRHEKVYQQ